jgi:uroporphyrinogen III methyltransferase/synthase
MFGRGGEEAAFLGRHGIACQVVPGVTAGLAAPMAAGIPITRRDLSSTVTLITGHEDPAKDEPAVDYRALAALIQRGGTLCIYMGMNRLDAIARQLQQHGAEPTTAAAIVQWGFTPRQRSVRSTLGDVGALAKETGFDAPAIVLIGAVAAVEEPGLDFYTNRPLFGRRIVITRTRSQASQLHSMLARRGALVLEAPTIELVAPADFSAIDEAITNIARFDWLILTSVNGAEALARRLAHLQLDSRHLAPLRVAVIGDATEAAVREHLGIQPDLVPPSYVAESLGQTLIDREAPAGKSILMLRADIARPTLGRMLTDAGAHVTDLPIYISRQPSALPDDVLAALRAGSVDWITFTSSSTARNMVQMLGPQRNLLAGVRTASIGPITSETMRQLDLPVTVEADPSNLDGLIAAIESAR